MLSSCEVLARLTAHGWVEVGRKGSHVQLKHPAKPSRVTVPHPVKDLPLGTLHSIQHQSGLKLTS